MNGKPPSLLYGYIDDVPVTKPVMGADEGDRPGCAPVPESILGAVGRGPECVCWVGELCALGNEVVDDESRT